MIKIDLPKGGHGDNSVPECCGYGCESGLLDVLFTVVHDGGENYDSHGERKNQEAQLGRAALQGVAENAQTLRVARKFEYAKDAEDTQGHEGARHLKRDKKT